MRVLLPILALAACNPHRWPPDELCAHGERVYHHADQAGPLCHAADRLDACAQKACPPAKWPGLSHDLNNVNIDAVPPPLYCSADGDVPGCQDGLDIKVTEAAVVYDELGHLAWEHCFGRTGERSVNGRRIYDEDFVGFVAGCRSAP